MRAPNTLLHTARTLEGKFPFCPTPLNRMKNRWVLSCGAGNQKILGPHVKYSKKRFSKVRDRIISFTIGPLNWHQLFWNVFNLKTKSLHTVDLLRSSRCRTFFDEYFLALFVFSNFFTSSHETFFDEADYFLWILSNPPLRAGKTWSDLRYGIIF